MLFKEIKTESAPSPVGPYSQALEVGDLLFCSGQISIVPETGEILKGSITEQTQQIMKNIEAVLNAAGLGLDNVIKSMIFLTDMGDFAEMNEVYASALGDHRPARSCVAVSQLPKGVNVEIEVLAKRA